MVAIPLLDMKENSSWRMQSLHNPHWASPRRPQTAVWRIPKTDVRREKYSKSAREQAGSYEIQSPVSSSSAASSLDDDIASNYIDLHVSSGASHRGSKYSSYTLPSDGKLPHILGSPDQTRSIVSEGSSMSLNLSGHHSSQTYLTSVEIKTPWYMTVLQEKERCLLKLGEEINRLSRYEVESKRKDEIISTMRSEIFQLQRDLQQSSHLPTTREETTLPASPSMELLDRFSLHTTNTSPELEEYSPGLDLRHNIPESPSSHQGLFTGSERKVSATSSASSLSQTQRDRQNLQEAKRLPNDGDATREDGSVSAEGQEQRGDGAGVDESSEKNEIIQKLQDEIQTMKKDYQLAKGAVSSLQRALSTHETKLRKSESEKENLQRELTERAIQLQAMSKKFSSLREERKHEEMMASIEKENYDLRELLSDLKSEVGRRNDIISDLKADIQRLQREILGHLNQIQRQETERGQTDARMKELTASEQHLKVVLETLQSRFERFRSKIIQAAYTAPGSKAPQTELSDTDILEIMQKIISERSEFHQQLKQKGVKVPPLHQSEAPTTVKQTPSATRKKAP